MFEVAPVVSYRPKQCPKCQNYAETIKRCRGFTTSSNTGFRPLLGQFKGESEENCYKFIPAVK
jgi:hypothetical protein